MRQLTSLDAQFLGVETSRTYGHVGGLAVYDPSTAPGGTLEIGDVCRMVSERLHMLPPFRWRLVEVPFGIDLPYWVEDPAFDLDFHIRESAVPPPGDDRRLAETVARIFARPLDRSRPLWELYLIQGLEDGRVAMLTKLHHSMVDGVSGNEILGVLLDPSPRGQGDPAEARGAGRRARPRRPRDARPRAARRAAPAAARAALAADGAAEPDRPPGRQRVPGRAAARRDRGCARGRRGEDPGDPRGDDRAAAEDELQRPRRPAPALRVRLALARHASSGSRTSSGSPSTTSWSRCAPPRCATGCSTATSCPRSRSWR